LVKELIAEVRRLAEANPDFVYRESNCLYNSGGDPANPGCIMGRAWRNVTGTSIKAEGQVISDVLERYNINTTAKQRHWLTSVQDYQDARTPWGEAVILADSSFPVCIPAIVGNS
jgi:hypothetical protein